MKKFLLLVVLPLICFVTNAQYWSPVGTGMNVGNYSNRGFVYAFDTLNGSLFMGGTMDSAGGIAVSNICEWDGSNWSSLNGGTNSVYYSGYYCVNALATYNNHLYAAGRFDTIGGVVAHNIAEWNGTTWNNLGSGIVGTVLALTTFNGNLYAAGAFDSAGGKRANYIAVWNGSSWAPFGNGLNGTIYALYVYNSHLYAGGVFDTAGGIPVNNITEWSGTSWIPLGKGVYNNSNYFSYVRAISSYNGDLVVGGVFNSAGSWQAQNIATWNGTTWNSIGMGVSGTSEGTSIRSLAVYNGNLFMGGLYDSANGNISHNISSWNGSVWDSLDGGVSMGTASDFGTSGLSFVYAQQVYNNELYVGGAFQEAGNLAVNNIARWGTITGINEVNQNFGINVYPNPSTDVFNFELRGVNTKAEIEVYNMLGEKVYCETLRQAQDDNTINLSEQPSGIYLYRIVSESGSTISQGKLIKE